MRRIALGVLCCGCVAPRAFPCEQQSDCVLKGEHGWCEQPVGYCSYPDDACASNRRFEDLAGDDFGGQCVPGGEDGSGGESPGCGWQSVHAGELHACGLDSAGSVRCWGANYDGQLGNNSDSPFESVARQTKPPLSDVLMLAAGSGHTCALGSQGEVWCWGRNAEGQVSWPLRNSNPKIRSPLLVDVPLAPQGIVVGGKRSCIFNGTEARCWGDVSALGSEFYALTLPGIPRSVASGDAHVCLAVEDGPGAVYCVGENEYSQLGLGDEIGKVSAGELYPVVGMGGEATELAAGRDHTCAVIIDAVGDRYVECWGRNQTSQAGASPGGPIVWEPQEVSGEVHDGPWIKLAAAPAHSCALAETGEVYCWGDNAYGQSSIQFDPAWAGDSRRVMLPDYPSLLAVDIAAAGPATCAITVDDEWVCWGCMTPWQVEGCTPGVKVVDCE